MTGTLIIARQGQNEGDAFDRFVGLSQYRLTYLGREEAKGIGRQLVQSSLSVDVMFCPDARQSQESAKLILRELKSDIPVVCDPALNERDFGDLTNMRKDQAIELFGPAIVIAWKRSFEVTPSSGESLHAVHDRIWRYFNSTITPLLKDGRSVLVIGDGDCTRALALEIEELSPAQIETVEFERGQVIAYVFDNPRGFRQTVVHPHRAEPHLKIVT